MRPPCARAALTTFAILGLAACSAAGPNGAGTLASRHPLAVALPPGVPADVSAPGSVLAAYLERALGRPVQLRAEPTYAAVAADLKAERVDVAFTSDVGYLAVGRATHVRVIGQAATKASSNPAIVCGAAAGVKSLEDGGDWSSLRGKSVLFGPEGSLAGNVWPRYFMSLGGIDPIGDLLDARAVANELEAMLDVYNGIADCAATAADDRGQVADVAPDVTARVSIVFSAPSPVPPPPVIARADLATSDATSFVKALISIARNADAAAQLAGVDGAPAGRAARDSDYALLRTAVTTVDPSLVAKAA